ncbi:MAG: crcB protein [Oscillospiraceae bacterium]|nr:crcB protein [Oscillospiraceae bacterium]
MIKCIFIGLGGFIGSICRYLVGLAFLTASSAFPISTLIINFVGSFIIGIITEFSIKIVPINTNLLAFLTIGICGGFTTFSTFSLETINLFEKGKLALGFAYALSSVVLCLTAVIAGKCLIRYIAH